MKHLRKRILKIIDEVVNYLFVIGASDMTINVKEEDNLYKISLKSDYSNKYRKKINELEKNLKCPKQEEMEEYYWELTGDCDIDTELTLVGMMTDDAEVILNNETIEVILYKYK